MLRCWCAINRWPVCLQGAEGGNRRVVPGGAVQALWAGSAERWCDQTDNYEQPDQWVLPLIFCHPNHKDEVETRRIFADFILDLVSDHQSHTQSRQRTCQPPLSLRYLTHRDPKEVQCSTLWTVPGGKGKQWINRAAKFMSMHTHNCSEYIRAFTQWITQHENTRYAGYAVSREQITLSQITFERNLQCDEDLPQHKGFRQYQVDAHLISLRIWMHFQIHLAKQYGDNWILLDSIAPHLSCTLMVPEGITVIQTKESCRQKTLE